MRKSKIDWCDATYSPVTGCLHGFPYCYARKIAHRFEGHWSPLGRNVTEYPIYPIGESIAVLDHLEMFHTKHGKLQHAPYPYGFYPTYHRYRTTLDKYAPTPRQKPKTIFVCPTSDLFGGWVSDWIIEEVFDACKRAPQHRYLFLTKNAERYVHLANAGKLPEKENFWFGSTVTKDGDAHLQSKNHNTFISYEPIKEKLYFGAKLDEKIDWLIFGVETGNAPDKFIPTIKQMRDWFKPNLT